MARADRSVSRTRSTGLRGEVVYRVLEGRGVLRSRVRLTNGGTAPVTVESVTSFLGSGLSGPGGDLGDVDLLWAENDWLGREPLAAPGATRRPARTSTAVRIWTTRGAGLASPALGAGHQARTCPWAPPSTAAPGTPGSGRSSTTGAGTGRSASTRVATRPPRTTVAARRRLSRPAGPYRRRAPLAVVLEPGESFETVPVAVAFSSEGFEAAVAAAHRTTAALFGGPTKTTDASRSSSTTT